MSEEKRQTGATPLYIACQNGHEACARLLLDRDAKVDLARQDGATPLIMACQNSHEACARLLLERGANTDVRSGGRSARSVAREKKLASVLAAMPPRRAGCSPCLVS